MDGGLAIPVDHVARCGILPRTMRRIDHRYGRPQQVETEDGLSHVFAANVLAPSVLTRVDR